MPAVLPAPPPKEATEAISRVSEAVSTVIRGKERAIRLCLAALLARGQILIEDIPGVGKTTLARALAAALGGTFRRVQFTSDLLPSDILGTSVYNSSDRSFEFRRGPIFANVVLADEINRTTPRTQSALLEVMSEGRVSVDDVTHELDKPFLVIATQNPVEHFGTYPLPESQMDRFLIRLRLGYPGRENERAILRERTSIDPVSLVEPVIDSSTLATLQDSVENVAMDDELIDYALNVVEETRRSPQLAVGVSTRGALAWYRVAQANALVSGRDYCVPDDLRELAGPALAHRVTLSAGRDAIGQAREEAEKIIEEILDTIAVPA